MSKNKEFNISNILPTKEEKLKSQLGNKKFCEFLLWFISMFRDEGLLLIYSKDIQKDFKISQKYALDRILQFADLGLIKYVNKPGTKLAWAEPIYNNERLVLEKYENRAKKTLGLK